MVRLRNAVMVFALAAGMAGCSTPHGWQLSPTYRSGIATRATTFPSPANGPNDSMIPGTYTGPLASGSRHRPNADSRATGSAPPSGVPPAGGTRSAPAITTRPTPPTPPNP